VADPVTIARRLPAGFGVVYRHFGAPERRSVAQALARVCQRRRLVLLIAADPALAREVGADGVHWPFRLRQGARLWNGRFRLQTISAHSAREVRAAARLPADGLLVSTVFSSGSASAGKPLGANRFRLLARQLDHATYALGGISAENAGQIARFAGFSAVEAFAAFGETPRT
jgi:thiamine-phosphate pyrophosphorylase